MYHNTLARAAKHDALRHIIALDLLEFDKGTLEKRNAMHPCRTLSRKGTEPVGAVKCGALDWPHRMIGNNQPCIECQGFLKDRQREIVSQKDAPVFYLVLILGVNEDSAVVPQLGEPAEAGHSTLSGSPTKYGENNHWPPHT
jgi:hypothetical protein